MMDKLLELAVPYWKGSVAFASAHLQRGDQEVELVLASVLTTLVTIFILRLTTRLLFASRKQKLCCAREALGKSETPTAVPPEAALMAEVQAQLVLIHKEIVNLKHERELVDTELIETSTQILQAISASFAGPDEFSRESEYEELAKPVPVRQTQMVQSPAVRSEYQRPTEHQRVAEPQRPTEHQRVAEPQRPTEHQRVAEPVRSEYQRPAEQRTAVEPVRSEPVRADHQFEPVRTEYQRPTEHPRQTEPQRQVEPQRQTERSMEPVRAVPKMSAIAAARMKRESELANAPAVAPVGSTNPFGKARAAPFTMG